MNSMKDFREAMTLLGAKLCGNEPPQSGIAKHIDMDEVYDYQEKVTNHKIRKTIRKILSDAKRVGGNG